MIEVGDVFYHPYGDRLLTLTVEEVCPPKGDFTVETYILDTGGGRIRLGKESLYLTERQGQEELLRQLKRNLENERRWIARKTQEVEVKIPAKIRALEEALK